MTVASVVSWRRLYVARYVRVQMVVFTGPGYAVSAQIGFMRQTTSTATNLPASQVETID